MDRTTLCIIICILSFFLGIVSVVGWFVYPLLTLHWPVYLLPKHTSGASLGDHTKVIGIVGSVQHVLGVRVITINGLPDAYVVALKGHKGEWVMVEGYSFGYGGLGTVIVGNPTRSLSVAAHVRSYLLFPLYAGAGLLALSGVSFLAGLFLGPPPH